MAQLGRPRLAVVVGSSLVVGAVVGVWATGPSLDVWRGAMTGVGILGAAMIIRTIGPSSRPEAPGDDDDPGPL